MIINEKRDKKLKEIFNLLDSDKDGYISAASIGFSGIPNDVIDHFSSVFLKMEKGKHIIFSN